MVFLMKKSIEELFVQVEREYEFDLGYTKGFNEGKNEVIDEVAVRMLRSSVDEETIVTLRNCSRERLQKLKRKTN